MEQKTVSTNRIVSRELLFSNGHTVEAIQQQTDIIFNEILTECFRQIPLKLKYNNEYTIKTKRIINDPFNAYARSILAGTGLDELPLRHNISKMQQQNIIEFHVTMICTRTSYPLNVGDMVRDTEDPESMHKVFEVKSIDRDKNVVSMEEIINDELSLNMTKIQFYHFFHIEYFYERFSKITTNE